VRNGSVLFLIETKKKNRTENEMQTKTRNSHESSGFFSKSLISKGRE